MNNITTTIIIITTLTITIKILAAKIICSTQHVTIHLQLTAPYMVHELTNMSYQRANSCKVQNMDKDIGRGAEL